MTRIALFLGSFFGRGVARVRLNMCATLLDRGYDVDLVVLSGEGDMRQDVPDGVRLIDLAAPRALAAVPKIRRYLLETQPAALISAQDHVNVAVLLARRLSGLNIPTSVSVHNVHTLEASKPPWSKKYWMQYAVRLIYPWATIRVSVSSGLGDTMATVTGLPRDSIETIFNPVIDARLTELAQEPCPHPWLGDGGPRVVLGVGRLTFQKDFEGLIESFDSLRQERDVRLVILGDGFRHDALVDLITDKGLREIVDLPGYVSNPFTYMANADVFVLSSIHEGLPGVLIQAMGCGCPVVSTDCPHGPMEILDGGKLGPLVPIKDPQALTTAIAQVLDAPLAPDVLKARAQLFEANHILDQYRDRLGF